MKLSFFNSLSRKREIFSPQNSGKVKIYACGVTVYDHCHLGHARGAVNLDVLVRLLSGLHYEVLYVKNFTDVDDKIIASAARKNQSVEELTREMIEMHDRDMGLLFVSPPKIAPKATDHIQEMIELIEELIRKDFAYEQSGDVFFRVRKFPEYGKLSGKNPDDLIAGIRVEKSDLKEDPNDFVLWKGAKSDEPFWESPWGKGRPGWHIECSAMARKYLGKTFDIHWGGSDLIFPHHENEIAQSEAAHGKTMANYWMHNGMVCIQGEKMSKSLGNYALIRELTKYYRPELIRFYILQTHYRQNFDFSESGIAGAKEGLDKIYEALQNFEKFAGGLPDRNTSNFPENPRIHPFLEALAQDLNTPKALSEIFALVKELNRPNIDVESAGEIAATILESGQVLGIFNESPQDWFHQPRIKKENTPAISSEKIEEWIEQRNKAKAEKNYEEADRIRNDLDSAGIVLKDSKEGTSWIFR